MQLQEGLAEAGGEGGGGLGDAALGACQLCGKAGQEVVLGLLRGQDGDRGQNAERISSQEDDVLAECELAASNENFELLVNTKTGLFAFRTKDGEHIWWSNPYNADDDPVANIS